MLAKFFLIPATLLLGLVVAAPLPTPSTCVTSTLNPGSCDNISGSDNTTDASPTITVDPSILRLRSVALPIPDITSIIPTDPVTTSTAASSDNVCVTSTLNPDSCNTITNSGNTIDVDPNLDVSPTIL